jgi:CRISPR-associated endonuclease/helicase Cas3
MSLLSFDDILKNDFFNFNIFIKDIDSYFAHLSKDNLETESLLAHSNLVLKYAIRLIKDNGIENSINEIIKSTTDNLEIQNDMKLFYLKAIYWHDIGKINENFQKDKMSNDNFENIDNGISSKHSILSAYLYLLSCFKYINQNYKDNRDRIELISICIYFSLTLWRHHTGLYSSWREFLNGSEGIEICNNLYDYTSKLNVEIDEQMHQVLVKHLKNIKFKRNEDYYILSKSLFSLLIISDYYATAQFMNYGNRKDLAYDNFGLIGDEFRDKIYKEFYIDKFETINGEKKQKTFNQALKDKISKDFKSFKDLKEKSNDNLNHLRNKLFVEVRENLRKNIDKNLFYIEAPTGAGKTNLSIMSAIEILKEDKSINKIFYVFPFTTLITQTYGSIKNVLNLDNSEIVQLHSKAKYNDKTEIEKDGVYGDEKINFLDNQFMNYPITLLSHVKFFNVLTGVSKDDNYIFHRLANSIVIIDEIQTYNPNLWSQIVYLLDTFSKKFNIKFIVMSATLPKIGDIIDSKFIFLVSNKQQYFQNPNFGDRVAINTKTIKVKEPKSIYSRVLKESKAYQKKVKNKKVKTIIEFITKKGADEFYQEAVEKNNNFFDEIFILSGTILEPRRREIIDFLKNKKDKNVLLVATQVVEAGVDIDMDIGFKEKSLIDSDEQLAGRINRNSSKEGNKLFLFEMENHPKAKFVYKGDKRLGVEERDVLTTKDFDEYYNQVLKKLKIINNSDFIENLNSYKDHIKNLRFLEAHIEIIDMESVSVFVPIDENAKGAWEKYESLVLNREIEFIDKQIELKKLASIFSNYTFSLAKYDGSGVEYFKNYCDEKYGYWYLKEEHIAKDDNFDEVHIYSYKNGLDTKVLKDENAGMFI